MAEDKYSEFHYGKVDGLPGDLAFFSGSGLTDKIASGGGSGGSSSNNDNRLTQIASDLHKIQQKLEEGICKCDEFDRGLSWKGYVDSDPTELEDGQELHLIKNGQLIPFTPKKDNMVGFDGKEFIYAEGEYGECEWIELGEEQAHVWNS